MAPSGGSSSPISMSPTSEPPTTTSSPTPTVEPVRVPPNTPSSFDQDLDGTDLPPAELVPSNGTATGAWVAETAAGQTVVVSYAVPSSDPLRVEQGLVVWRRFDVDPPWRPVYGIRDRPEAGVLRVDARIGDATGDGSDDALTFEETGGSGACGTWSVIDLAANMQVFERKTCDTMIDLSSAPAGLVVVASVYEQGDAHCCPSGVRTTVLVYGGLPDAWRVDSTTVSPAG